MQMVDERLEALQEFAPVLVELLSSSNVLLHTPESYVDAAVTELARLASKAQDGIPVFAIKASDNLALNTVMTYHRLCIVHNLDEQALQVALAMGEIAVWRDENPHLCKWPDHKHVSASVPPAVWRHVAAKDYDEPLRGMIERGECEPPDELVRDDVEPSS